MRIAVIGSGIAGLSAAWLSSSRHQVTLYEAGDYFGGHSHTIDVELDGMRAPVDTGFLVCNDWTYPNLLALFRRLDIATEVSDMSFSVRLESPQLEWGGHDLGSLFAQARNLTRPRFWRMLRDILRFNTQAPALLASHQGLDINLGELLDAEGYSDAFRDWYLLPMAAAIWSSPPGRMLDFPAASFIRFCRNHGLLQISGRPRWRTVRGGSREYVARMVADLDDARLNEPVSAIRRLPQGVEVISRSGLERFDACVLACHADQALALLSDPDPVEADLLADVRYQDNQVIVHTDASFLPRRQRVWSAWNYHAADSTDQERPVAVSYLINKLQPLPFQQPVIVTLNPYREPAPGTELARFSYAHPLLDQRAWRATSRLDDIQGRRNTWFCGAWTGYGFHEDGLKSGMAVAEALGSQRLWNGEQAA